MIERRAALDLMLATAYGAPSRRTCCIAAPHLRATCSPPGELYEEEIRGPSASMAHEVIEQRQGHWLEVHLTQ